jgi:hypothetical protein
MEMGVVEMVVVTVAMVMEMAQEPILVQILAREVVVQTVGQVTTRHRGTTMYHQHTLHQHTLLRCVA